MKWYKKLHNGSIHCLECVLDARIKGNKDNHISFTAEQAKINGWTCQKCGRKA